MELNEKEAKALLSKINSKCAPYTCPMCKNITNFIFAPAEFQFLSFNRKGTSVEMKDSKEVGIIPVIHGVCNNCGFIASFSINHVLGER